MSDEFLEPITPDIIDEPQNNTIKIIIIIAVVVLLCICVCLCVFFFLPALFGPVIGDVFSDIVDEMMLTPIP